jgi:hypothetical protein
MSAFPVLTKLACPNCGKPVEQFNPNAQTLVCSACGSFIAVGGEQAELLGKGRKLRPPKVPIEVGQVAQIGDTQFLTMGRVVYTGWDDEDRWTWDEWLLGGADGRLLWLSFDEKGFTLYRKLRLQKPFNPHNDSAIPVGDRFVRVHERYPARIDGAEGELTWRATQGEQLYMVEAAGLGKRYSIQATPSELEVHEGDPLTELQVAQAYKDDKWIKQVTSQAGMASILVTVGVICLVFALFALIVGFAMNNSGEPVVSQTVNIGAVEESEAVIPIEFDQVNRPAIITVALRGGLPENTGFDLDISVMSPNETETFLFIKEFWHETGRDEDGPWRETAYSASDMFVPTVPGRHELVLTMEDTMAGFSEFQVDVGVVRNHITPLWYIVYAVVAGLIGLILFYSAARLRKPG